MSISSQNMGLAVYRLSCAENQTAVGLHGWPSSVPLRRQPAVTHLPPCFWNGLAKARNRLFFVSYFDFPDQVWRNEFLANILVQIEHFAKAAGSQGFKQS